MSTLNGWNLDITGSTDLSIGYVIANFQHTSFYEEPLIQEDAYIIISYLLSLPFKIFYLWSWSIEDAYILISY